MVKYLFKNDVVDAYPDGWTCIGCGTEFSEKTINVECLYVIQNEEGTECLKCFEEDLFWANDTPNHLKKNNI
jgi:hypothetical protein